jgi:peptidoglycan glycosyltransferase
MPGTGRRATRWIKEGFTNRTRCRRLFYRALPLALLAAAAFLAGVYVADSGSRAQQQVALRYARAWERGDYAKMYGLLTPAARRSLSQSRFKAKLTAAAGVATLQSLHAGKQVSASGGHLLVPVTVRTLAFGAYRAMLELAPVGAGSGTHFRFNSALLLPGLHASERLHRATQLSLRGSLLAANGAVLAQGSSLATKLPKVAGAIAGTLGAIPAAQRAQYRQLGYPADAQVGSDGLEAIFQDELAGRAGGQLLAGDRVLAQSSPIAGRNVRTTIVPKLELAALAAIGSAYAGVTAIDPQTGAVEAAAGLAFDTVQPPGSTFKIVTAAAALSAGLVTPATTYAYETQVNIDGFNLQNAAGESCGGTLLYAFAQSCDTVFAPLGVRIGAARLVATAERFGFDQPTGSSTVMASTIPSAAAIGGPVAVGATSIGQGKVQATTLEMADVAATVANAGLRPLPTFLAGAKPRYVRAVDTAVAHEIERMMVAVVTEGTGETAQIQGVTVAGKTGTAELRNTSGKINDTKGTDAWFVGFAPAMQPQLAVCALYPEAGYGETAAAPAVRKVLMAALGVR